MSYTEAVATLFCYSPFTDTNMIESKLLITNYKFNTLLSAEPPASAWAPGQYYRPHTNQMK